MRVVYGKGFSVAKPESMREKVERLEEELRNQPQVECTVRHFFAPGRYTREMTIPAGVTATGAVHKTTHRSAISVGRCLLTTDEGVKELCAPYVMVSKAGSKRAILALEETVFTTYHETNETDLDKLVELLTESKASELLGGADNKQLAANRAAELLEV